MSTDLSSTAMSMPSSTADPSSTAMPMSSMQMNFFSSANTPLYSSAWTPTTSGSYAGTCIFLIILATIFRVLVVGKHVLEQRWLEKELNRRTIYVRGKPVNRFEPQGAAEEVKSPTTTTEQGGSSGQEPVRRQLRPVAPWRLSVDFPRAAYVTVLAGVGYLLMIAVMTMNVGYFLSVLGGTFLGELAVGKYTQLGRH